MSVWRKSRGFDPEATQDVRAQLIDEGFERLADILYEPLAKQESLIRELEARVRGLEQERAKYTTETGVTRIIENSRNSFLAKHGEKVLYILITALVGLIGRCSAGT